MTTIDYAMRVATQLQEAGKFADAKIILKNIVDSQPAHAYALHLSGIVCYQMGESAAGIEFVQQAIANHATNALFHSNLGEMYRQLKNLDLSIQHGQRAVLLDPNSATALSNLGIAYYDAKQFEQAEECHKRALTLQPTLSYSLNNLGSIYKVLGKTQHALALYQAAIAAAPDCAEAYYGSAQIYLHTHNFIAAENAICQALTIHPHQIEYYHLLAEIYYEQGDNAATLVHLNHALSLNPTFASSYLSKGSVLMEMGEIASAEEQFLKVIQDSSVDTRLLAHYSLVQLRKIKNNNSSLEALLEIAENIEEVSLHKREYAYFALGKCHDDIGEWQKAFAWFARGCQTKRKQITYDIAEQVQMTNSIIHQFTQETIAHLRQFAHPSNLPIFIVGMPRSGTSLVEQIVASHADVHGAGELTYFLDLVQHPVDLHDTKLFYPDNILHRSSEICHSIIEKYLTYLRRFSTDAIRVTDKMPQNFIAIGLIHALFPNAKIIHVKRNPIDTCLSCYTKLFSKGHYYSYDLAELGQYYNCYAEIMAHWRRILPENAWLDVNYEDIIQNTETEVRRLIDYCNLTWDPACLAFHESKRAVRTASFMQVRQPVYTSSLDRWRRFETELAPLIKILDFNM